MREVEEEQKELSRKLAEEKEREERDRLKVSELSYLLSVISSKTNSRGEIQHPSSYHASAIRKMPVMKNGMESGRWFGETFGLESEDDCAEAFQVAFEGRLVVAYYDDQGRIEHFRGEKTKTPAE